MREQSPGQGGDHCLAECGRDLGVECFLGVFGVQADGMADEAGDQLSRGHDRRPARRMVEVVGVLPFRQLMDRGQRQLLLVTHLVGHDGQLLADFLFALGQLAGGEIQQPACEASAEPYPGALQPVAVLGQLLVGARGDLPFQLTQESQVVEVLRPGHGVLIRVLSREYR